MRAVASFRFDKKLAIVIGGGFVASDLGDVDLVSKPIDRFLFFICRGLVYSVSISTLSEKGACLFYARQRLSPQETTR